MKKKKKEKRKERRREREEKNLKEGMWKVGCLEVGQGLSAPLPDTLSPKLVDFWNLKSL